MAGYPQDLEKHWEDAGERLAIRPVRPEDAPAHEAFFHRLSPEDVRFRFFAAIRELSPAQLARFTRPDYDRDIAFIAVRERTGETVGVARLARTDRDGVAEFAVVVQPDMRDHGLGRRLMTRLIDWAPTHGITEIRGEVLADNANMLSFCRYLGFRLRHSASTPEVIEASLLVPHPPPN